MKISQSDVDPNKIVVTVAGRNLVILDHAGKVKNHQFPVPVTISEEMTPLQFFEAAMQFFTEIADEALADEVRKLTKSITGNGSSLGGIKE